MHLPVLVPPVPMMMEYLKTVYLVFTIVVFVQVLILVTVQPV